MTSPAKSRSSSQPLVSLCVPSYNSAPFLQTLFNSLLSQTYRNIELIFRDDASTDASFDLALKYEPALKKAFPHVSISQSKQNMGAILNLHEMFRQVNGDLVAYLDADDYYVSHKIERNVEFFNENPDYGAVHSNFFAIEHGLVLNRDLYDKDFRRPTGWVFDELLRFNFICAATMMVRREFFDRAYTFDVFRRRDYRMGDYPAYFQLSRITQIGYIDERLAYYRVQKSSMSHAEDERQQVVLLEAIRRVQQDARLGILQPLPLK